MTLTNITMDLTALNNISAPNIDLSGAGVFETIVEQANLSTNNYLLVAMLLAISTIVFWTLSDKTPFGDFQYDDLRALSVSLAICSLLGLTIVSSGWSPNFWIVGTFSVLFMCSYILILIYENKE